MSNNKNKKKNTKNNQNQQPSVAYSEPQKLEELPELSELQQQVKQITIINDAVHPVGKPHPYNALVWMQKDIIAKQYIYNTKERELRIKYNKKPKTDDKQINSLWVVKKPFCEINKCFLLDRIKNPKKDAKISDWEKAVKNDEIVKAISVVPYRFINQQQIEVFLVGVRNQEQNKIMDLGGKFEIQDATPWDGLKREITEEVNENVANEILASENKFHCFYSYRAKKLICFLEFHEKEKDYLLLECRKKHDHLKKENHYREVYGAAFCRLDDILRSDSGNPLEWFDEEIKPETQKIEEYLKSVLKAFKNIVKRENENNIDNFD